MDLLTVRTKTTCPYGNNDTSLLGQDQGFRQILQNFLRNHPADAFQAVNDGGNDLGYDYVRYASSISFSDACTRLESPVKN